MSSKPFQRKDIKHDEFILGAGRLGHWLMDRRRRIGWVVLGIAVVVSVIFSVRFAHQRQEQQAAALLAGAMDVYRAPVIPPAPEPVVTPVADSTDGTTDPADAAADGAEGAEAAVPDPILPPVPEYTGLQYATLIEKNNAAIERFEPIVERYGGRPSGRLAAYYLGICQSELGNTEAAITALTQAADASAPLISAMAMFRLGQLELGVGNAEAALGIFENLLEQSAGIFPREEALMAKGRAQRDSGDARAALTTYQLVLDEFAGSYAAAEAQARVEELSAELGVELRGPTVPSD